MPAKLGGDRDVLAPTMGFAFLQPVYTGGRITRRATYDGVVERDDRYGFTWDVVRENRDGESVLDATIEGLVWRDT